MAQFDWQRAYALLQFIMQVVTVEVCASLIFPAASAPPASPTMLVASNTHIDARGAIIHGLPLTVAAPHPNLNREANLDNTSECVDLDQTNLIDLHLVRIWPLLTFCDCGLESAFGG